MRFEALELSLAFIRAVREYLEQLRSQDPDLYRQVRKAASSVSLNLAEGSGRSGKDRRYHYRIALGSAREVHAALRTACAWGDLEPKALQPVLETLDRLQGLLWGLTH